jgi:hypothetical protein
VDSWMIPPRLLVTSRQASGNIFKSQGADILLLRVESSSTSSVGGIPNASRIFARHSFFSLVFCWRS